MPPRKKREQTLTDDVPSGPPRRAHHVVRDLAQAKLLSEPLRFPLRLRLLQAFAAAPQTTKQVAQRLGERPSRLYPHVDALLQAGLLEQVAVRQKRGAIEKYLQAIAARFEIDSTLFLAEEGGHEDALTRSILDTTREELYRSAPQAAELDDALKPLVLRFEVHGTPRQIVALRQKLLDWVARCQAHDPSDDGEKTVSYAGTVAFYPRPKG